MKALFKITGLLALWLVMGMSSGLMAQTYTVNTTSLGVGGPTDISGSIDVMIENALNSANSGNTVVVNLDASGIINLNISLPVLTVTHPSGKITIQKDPSASVDQGIKRTGAVYAGFNVFLSEGDIDIKNLSIEGFNQGTAIYPAADGETPGDILISGNTYEKNTAGIQLFYSGKGSFAAVSLTGNTIEGFTSYTATPNAIGIRCELIESEENPSAKGTLDLTVQNNTISLYRYGMRIANVEAVTEATMDVTINNNTVSSCTNGISLSNYKEAYWTFTNNDISDCDVNGLRLNTYNWSYITDHTYSPFSSTFNMVEPGNSAGISANNTGNTIEECTYNAVLIDQMDEVYIVNMDLEGSVKGLEGMPYHIRENLISKPTGSPAVSFRPIWWQPGVNNDIPSSNPISATVDGSDVVLNYSLYGLEAANAPFKLEFFLADENRSLTSFLGNKSVATAAAVVDSETFTGLTTSAGDQIAMTITSLGGTDIGTSEVVYMPIQHESCDTCFSFRPQAGETYWISAWVYENHNEPVLNYQDANIQLNFVGALGTSVQFYPTGEIIDGWQRVVGKFTMPADVTLFNIQLNAHPTVETYFDDVRIHPFNGSMKSYVYDGDTFWLTSELDDNNYATFYEYDEEGGLVRIKKETSRGIVTIQETRSNTKKQEDGE